MVHLTRAASWVALTAATALVLSGCGATGSAGDPTDVNPEGEIKPREISWLLSRPADGGVITAMQKIADEYAADHPGFSLNLITTPDRPSYIQKYETLAAANKLPELFDTDATPFAQKLAQQGRMVDVDLLLKDLGLSDQYRDAALNYQRFDDGSLYMVPFEFQLEFFWYNKDLLAQAGVSVPATLDDFAPMCQALRAKGITPIALDGSDGWPLERYMAYYPFRQAGPEYVQKLKTGQAKFSDAPGRAAADWLYGLGQAGCFQEGFSATGYADAQAQFTSGKAAVYNIGTWELANLATDKLDAGVRDSVDYFTLPTLPGAVGDRHAGQLRHLRPARTRFPALRPRALPRRGRRVGSPLPDHRRGDDHPRECDAAVHPGDRAGRRRGHQDRDAVGHAARPRDEHPAPAGADPAGPGRHHP